MAAVQLPLPPKTQLTQVTERALVKGMNLQISQFKSTLSVTEVVSFYQNLWPEKSIVTEFSPWTMVGSRSAQQFYNVQVQPQGKGSWGYLSVSDLPKQLQQGVFGKSTKQLELPAMSGSQLIDQQRHQDLLNTSKTWVLRNSYSVDANSQYYLNYYLQRGWKLLQDTRGSGLKVRVLLLGKAGQSVSLSVRADNGQSEIVANLIKGKIVGE